MKILFRNFINLLSVGTFETKVLIEPMSRYKWTKLSALATANGVRDYIDRGIVCKVEQGDDKPEIPQDIYEKALDGLAKYGHVPHGEKSVFNFSEAKKEKRFTNFYLNRKYKKMVFNEVHSIDTSVESMILVNKLIDNINAMLNNGADFRLLSDLGHYLREQGDKIDFIKIENWIDKLQIKNMSSLIGVNLLLLFHFEEDEVPFLKNKKKYIRIATEALEHKLAKSGYSNEKPEHATQPNEWRNINPIIKPNANPLKYFRLFPVETTSRFITNIGKSLSNIDE